MEKQQGFFISSNGRDNICYHRFMPAGEVKGIFQIVHGMAEHSLRYENFAAYLCNAGFAVYIHDHMGHGSSVVDTGQLGLFLDGNQADFMVEDVRKLAQIAKKENPDKKHILFGHSMGSFIVRIFASKYSAAIDGLIICGTGAQNSKAVAAKSIIKLMRVFRGRNHKSDFIDKLSFGKNNERYDEASTKFDWLSRDPLVVSEYIASDYCGFLFSLDGMLNLLDTNIISNKPEAFKSLRVDLPLLIISGDMDPVGDYGEGVKKVYDSYVCAGANKVTLKLYPDARHEILNETNKDEVYKDILDFALLYGAEVLETV
ncbi:MAG: alpha/beta hydrolase [Clostridiales bacterium]|nr:alpha/beta hydrolase [Clostridiales bacterium]